MSLAKDTDKNKPTRTRDSHYTATGKQKAKTRHSDNPNTAATKIKKREPSLFIRTRLFQDRATRESRTPTRSACAIRTTCIDSKHLSHGCLCCVLYGGHDVVNFCANTTSTATLSAPGNKTPSPSHPTIASDYMYFARTVTYPLAVRTCTACG